MKTKLFIVCLFATLFAKAQTAAFTAYPCTMPGTTVTNANIVGRRAFLIDNAGNKWIGFNGTTPSNFKLTRFNNTQWDTFPAFTALNANVNCLATDIFNRIWIGTTKGLVMYNNGSFTVYNTANSGLLNDTILSVTASANVYAGTNQGLSVFNGSSFSNATVANGMLVHNEIYSLAYENGTVWMGTQFGLDKFNGVSSVSYQLGSLGQDLVYCIYPDAQNDLWLGTATNGVVKFNGSQFNTMQQLFPHEDQDFIGVGSWPYRAEHICEGPHGGVFFGLIRNTGNAGAGCIELMPGGAKYLYEGVPSSNAPLNVGITNYSSTIAGLIQHDIGSSKIFIIPNVTGPATFLYSFDAGLYAEAGTPYNSHANSAFLDINEANTLISNDGSNHWDRTSMSSKYFLPKDKGTSPLFASGFWIGGYTNNSLHTAAMTYRQNGVDFWPGPLDPATDSISYAMIHQYDKVWKVNKTDIADFTYNWSAGNVQNGSFVPPASITTWPGNSPYGGKLAPFVDKNNDGIYNYHDGDYPLIKGDQMIWSIFNDGKNEYLHTETDGSPFGIEIQQSAYAYFCPNALDSDRVLNTTTFYNYKITNYSHNRYDSSCVSFWEDADLGNYLDDYVGCDVMNNFGYVYNADAFDEANSNNPGYGANTPVFACQVLNGPLGEPNDGRDNNNNGIIDEPNEKCLMSGFTYYNNNGDPQQGNPGNSAGGIQYYNFMNEYWKDGIPMTYGGRGVTAGYPSTRYLFPGNSDPYGIGMGGSIANPVAAPINYGAAGWTEYTAGNVKGDRRFMVNSGKFTMQPGGTYELDMALVFSQDSVSCANDTAPNICVINRAVRDNKRVRNWFYNGIPSCASISGIKTNMPDVLNLTLYPNPAREAAYIEFAQPQQKTTVEVYDMLGKIVYGAQYNEETKYVSLPVANLQSGVYMLKIRSAAGFSVKKFIKE